MSATFRFQRILRFKRRLREAAALQLGALVAEHADVERAHAAAHTAEAASRFAAGDLARAGGSAADLHLHADYQRAQAAAARALGARGADLARTIERRRADLVTRRTAERQFEVLAERADARRAAEEARRERLLHDDLARRQSPGEDRA
jgi:flagellar export protein FliJ